MGRVKQFDEQIVLNKAMHIFWEKGYEKTSMQDLVDHMGIHRRSIYDTFGDKHELFLKSLDCYEFRLNQIIKQQVKQDMTIKEKLETLFLSVSSVNNESPKGCLIVNSAAELSLLDEPIKKKIQELFDKSEMYLYQLLVEAMNKGEISKNKNLQELASYLHNAWVGIRVLAKTTNDQTKLHTIVKTTLSIIK
ncbi:division inhibitor protein [Listeria ivanovii subsp. londoniensis]|uniref:TetR/AcrR family transcriptional regulator n=2 Tax=Listeria ivanovii TaxID=1638 RepID=A0ABS1G162_LISIV|nr:TetR family transcriptional regulator [Listeria ivanovii subsp. londoniensis]EFR97334.1 TetR family transcriptional regulator [Listeria ivanovii FSL F6-596]MBK1960613.1 TetR/AcrR family transcriptional regulator [Listeria ivanovii subsp. londoniensis]SDW23070.1 TetR/AcrR family transcriptional regulator, transcriptional repressor for nem operon [Listeria ivanovii]VEH45681.1 division inhibitor protein [Listeria ivanovii subsp. londoniensis]